MDKVAIKENDDYGQIAYEAYGEYRHWKTFDDRSMPVWVDLTEEIRTAWDVAAQAVCIAMGHP